MRKIIKRTLPILLIGLVILGMTSGDVLANPTISELASKNLQTGTTVSLTILPATVNDCGVLDLWIDVNDVTDLYGVDVRLSFDPNVIEIVDFNPGGSVNIEPVIDPNLNFNASYWVRNIADNFQGTLWYAASSLYPIPAGSGSGHIAHLQVRVKSATVDSANFAFTYIKLSDPYGIEIPATGVLNGDVSGSSSVISDLDIIRLNPTTVQLQWVPKSTALVSQYKVYRSTTPYFYAQGTPFATITNTGTGTLTLNDPILGSAATNYFYAIRAECTGYAGSLSAASNQVGEFEYQLYETATTDFTWVGLVLDVNPDWTTAINLSSHIVANSNGTLNVKSISQWNPVSQDYETYIPIFPFTNFSVNLKSAYEVEIDIPGLAQGSVIWAQVGRLPNISMDNYKLRETATTDFNWILQPLDMTAITSTKSLANDIIFNSSAVVSVLSISRWNPIAQDYDTYIKPIEFGNFVTRFGYPYEVEVNVNNGDFVTWP